MRAWTIGEPTGIAALRLVDRPDPTPGAHDVRVAVRATSLNYRDYAVVRGMYGRSGTKPDLIPLSDGAGEVVTVGPHVSRVAVGDRVCGIFMPRWLAGGITPAAAATALGGGMVDGMLAEQVVLHEDAVVPIPPHLSFAEAATLPCAAVTAWHAIVDHGHTKSGDDVLVLGTGGVSIFALQFARMHGARVIATSSSDTKIARLVAMGAAATVNYRDTTEWQDAVRAATHGRGADLVVEVGGAGTLPRSIQAVRMGGKISVIGVLTGGEIDTRPILRNSIGLQGIYVGSRAMFEAMNRAIAQHAMRPVIDRVFPFAQAPDAYRHLASGQHFGKVVISVE